MEFFPTRIPDVLLIKPQVFSDQRGFFVEIYREARFRKHGIDHSFVQDNHSLSQRGTLRGLHYQVRQAQGKLIRVVVGEIFDVVVDIRRSSPTFGHWVGEVLSAQNKYQLWIPPGFAHGMYILSEIAEVIYKMSDYYAPEWERTLLWNDPDIGIEWPLLEGQELVLSEKDKQGKLLQEAELFD
jgi:dTDP-4-dehydrorhamnose 3,5-epimerase